MKKVVVVCCAGAVLAIAAWWFARMSFGTAQPSEAVPRKTPQAALADAVSRARSLMAENRKGAAPAKRRRHSITSSFASAPDGSDTL